VTNYLLFCVICAVLAIVIGLWALWFWMFGTALVLLAATVDLICSWLRWYNRRQQR